MFRIVLVSIAAAAATTTSVNTTIGFLNGQQTGRGGMPVFIGRRHQHGHGIGNVLGGLLRRVVGFLGSRGLDFLKQNRQTAVLNLIKTGLDIAKDVTSSKKVKEALKTRIPEGIKQTAQELRFQLNGEKPTEEQSKRPASRRPPAAAAPAKKSRRGTPSTKSSNRQKKQQQQKQPKDIFSQ